MQDKNDSEYQFGYVTFKELEKLEKNHHIIYNKILQFLWERLKTCPDITDNFPCLFYLADKDGQIVCSSKTFPDNLWVLGKRYPWAWTGDISTEVAHRKKGLATILMHELTKTLHKKGIGRGSVFSNNITLHIWRKLGQSLPGYVSRYLMIKRARPFFKAHIKSKLIIHILDLLSRPIIMLIFKFYYGKRKLDILDAETIKSKLIDKNKLNKLIPEIYYKNKLHFNDSLAKLIWKINVSNENSENKCSLYLLKDVNSLDPIAYFVIRVKRQLEPMGIKYKDFQLMTLMDYGLFKDDKRIYPTLLKELTKIFWKSESEVLEVISNSEIFDYSIKRMGMIKVGKGMSFSYSVPNNWDLNKDFNKLDSWHLTHFCGDGFSF